MRASASTVARDLRLRLLTLTALAALLTAAFVSLTPAQAQTPPEDLAIALSLAGDAGEVAPGSTIQVRLELSYGGARRAAGLSVSGGALSASDGYRWANGDGSVPIPSQQPGAVDRSTAAIAPRGATGQALATGDARGRFHASAWDGRTLAARILPTTGVDPQIVIYDTSTSPATYRASVANPIADRNGSADRFGTGHNDVLSPDLAALAVWQENADTAWLFVGAEAARDEGLEEIGALYIYELSYAANGALSIGEPHTLQPPANEYSNRVSGSAARYGSNVAISADGSTLVVGARRMNHVGALYVYTRPSAGWSALDYASGVKVTPVAVPSWGAAETRPFDPAVAAECNTYCRRVTANVTGPLPDTHPIEGARFGVGKLGISADGATIAVGAHAKVYPDDTPAGRFSGGAQRGEVFIFTAPAGGWGNTRAVSGTEIWAGEDASAFNPALHYSPGPNRRVTAPTARLRPSPWAGAAAENFGSAVDISADGSVVAVASGTPRPLNTNEPIDSSAAYIFERRGRVWSDGTAPTAKFTLDAAARSWGAWGMELNAAGDTLLIGQRIWGYGQGRTIVIERAAGGWADVSAGLGDNGGLPPTSSLGQIALPFRDSNSTNEFGAPLYQLNGGGLAISATGHQFAYDHPGEIWLYRNADDRCVTTAGSDDDGSATVCAISFDNGRITIPADAGGSFTISAELTVGGQTLSDKLTVSVAAAAAEDDPAAALSSRAPNAFSTWQGQGSTTAAALQEALGGAVSAILLWQDGRWTAYGLADGNEIPGSTDFTIRPNATLWLGG